MLTEVTDKKCLDRSEAIFMLFAVSARAASHGRRSLIEYRVEQNSLLNLEPLPFRPAPTGHPTVR